MLRLRVKRPGETDYELWWLAVLAAGAALGLLWLKIGTPPTCWFHAITGLPCLTCGGTRCMVSLVHGQVWTALGWNPLVFFGALAAGLFAAYAVVVIALGLPRVRIGSMSKTQLDLVRVAVAVIAVGNWVYLVFRLSRAA